MGRAAAYDFKVLAIIMLGIGAGLVVAASFSGKAPSPDSNAPKLGLGG